ncbi:Myeloid lymphoid or mixed-lineage leukemia 2 [Cichlidogyrus casuarinus]|uniref:Myeloid lymphoid or mixed-lineage leukemia 2 n=1 Tax=Cichlidogyrus casuarinus TaxID=1844966 RepID=A0ABD2PPI6_9PLAT
MGNLVVRSIGQLAHSQIESGHFHTRRQIYPCGFRSERFYWSMRLVNRRAIYQCNIEEREGRPLFRVIECFPDGILEPETVEADSCDMVWRLVLERVAQLRREAHFVNVFPHLLRGEVMYGLREQQVLRAIESLHGVEHLSDYAFTYGRMELIHNMPLPLNPSGCARTECRLKMFYKRAKGPSLESPRRHPSSGLVQEPVAHVGRRGPSSSATVESVRNRAQQYRKLKSEARLNVTLGRSGIQGLGLYAARDLEPQTMVIEYIGELIRLELANRREKAYEAQGRGIYMFRLDEQTVIDATMTGGLARYVNHSCQPNCYTEYVNFGGGTEGGLYGGHIVIITNQRIAKGEELCYDYKFDLEDCTDKIPCLCKAPNCKKWMN